MATWNSSLNRAAFSATLHCLRGCAIGEVLPLAFATDTLSITVMEIVDNLIIVVIPGAMDAGLGGLLSWGSLAFALAFVEAFPVNRYLISRGKGHAVVHKDHDH